MVEPRCDVLLGHALFMARDPKQVSKMRPYPPLGTLYAAGVLRDAGLNVALFDAMIEDGPEAFDAALDLHRPRLVALFEDSFNFYSKMCLGTMRDAALHMVRSAAERGLPVVIAGSDASDDPGAFLAAGAKAVMLGEADHTLKEVALALREGAGADLHGIQGLALPNAGAPDGVHRTPPRPPERTPDVFGLPARDLVNMEAYRGMWQDEHGTWSLNMVSTRGCPFHCNWCAKPIWGQRYAMRDPVSVAEELALVGDLYGPDNVWFADDIFGLRPEWTAEFGRAMESLGARTPFTVQTRVDLIDDEAAEGLARAGCAQAWLGVESGSQRVLDAMEKGIKVEDVPAAVDRLRTRGVRVGMFIQFGYPGETWEDISRTVALVRETLPDEIGISVTYPLPGTSFHERVAEQLGDTTHWNDSRDLAMLFRGTYTTAFYRRLHTLLHRDLDARHALAGIGTNGVEDGETEELTEIEAEWNALARSEAAERNALPTLVELTAPKPAPDLTQASN